VVKCRIRVMFTRPRDRGLHIRLILSVLSISWHSAMFNFHILFQYHVATRRKHTTYIISAFATFFNIAAFYFDHLHASSIPSCYFSIIAFFNICILFRFPVATRHNTLQHLHLHSLSIPFDNTRYHFALLLQRHKIPSHYSASSHSFDSYSLIPRYIQLG
jgi:hypothetical protein